MKRKAERTEEEEYLCERLSETLKACRRHWDHIIDLMNARDRLSTMRDPDVVEKTQAINAVIAERGGELEQSEAAANRLLVRLGERPLRGLTRR